MHLYTNRGIGLLGVPIRVNCPPEITLVELAAGQGPTRASLDSSLP